MATHYTKEHEWIRAEGEEAIVGISSYAQEQLGDIVFVELPELGKQLKKGDIAAVVESVKAANEVYAPADGEVIAINDALGDDPGLVNQDSNGSGWFFRLKLADTNAATDGMMDDDAYKAHLADLD
ncbi:MAG: glycine cleavage system protein GcvH [Alphaproteobacteria bacterium]